MYFNIIGILFVWETMNRDYVTQVIDKMGALKTEPLQVGEIGEKEAEKTENEQPDRGGKGLRKRNKKAVSSGRK